MLILYNDPTSRLRPRSTPADPLKLVVKKQFELGYYGGGPMDFSVSPKIQTSVQLWGPLGMGDGRGDCALGLTKNKFNA